MGYVQRKDKWTDSVSAKKLFVPTTDDFMPENEVNFPEMEQFPPSAEMSVSVGIVSSQHIEFELDSEFHCPQTDTTFGAGLYVVDCVAGKLQFQDKSYQKLEFEPIEKQQVDVLAGHFCLRNVAIGVGFHWQRHENQFFKGSLKFLIDNEQVVAINILPVEDYLYSVISSEMSATSSLELLKAHAVISRSWLLKPMLEHATPSQASVAQDTENEHIKWYERDAHALFDVCADDHCQRYQGVGRARTSLVKKAIDATRGQVLMSDGKICDARFSKSCGGVSELFENCWANKHYKYLLPVRDARSTEMPDLTIEANADAWIRMAPEAFCNTADKEILQQVLNNYDQETTDFYRWKVSYTTSELSELVARKSGIDFGTIRELIPIERGASGRIVRLKIVGDKRSLIVGKELEIRKWLSESHLYSSAFVVDKTAEGFTLIGAGWGHGVGLCQIGAAVMGAQGYKYNEILAHYFVNSQLKKLW